jgi:hypothetical protein
VSFGVMAAARFEAGLLEGGLLDAGLLSMIGA